MRVCLGIFVRAHGMLGRESQKSQQPQTNNHSVQPVPLAAVAATMQGQDKCADALAGQLISASCGLHPEYLEHSNNWGKTFTD